MHMRWRREKSLGHCLVHQVMCDFTGGSLSLFQLCLEVRTACPAANASDAVAQVDMPAVAVIAKCLISTLQAPLSFRSAAQSLPYVQHHLLLQVSAGLLRLASALRRLR